MGPRMYRPVSPLGDYVESIGDWRSPAVDYWGRALPRGAVTVIFDVGQRQQLHFYAADGKTRLGVPPAFITGSHAASYVSNIVAGEPVMALHFRPGGAFPFLGIPLGDLEDAYVGIDEVWGSDGRDRRQPLHPDGRHPGPGGHVHQAAHRVVSRRARSLPSRGRELTRRRRARAAVIARGARAPARRQRRQGGPARPLRRGAARERAARAPAHAR